jgi:predicted Zn-dependent peptidase
MRIVLLLFVTSSTTSRVLIAVSSGEWPERHSSLHKSVPIISVNVWYHGVGQRARGRTGFAHLFDTMFEGSKNVRKASSTLFGKAMGTAIDFQ